MGPFGLNFESRTWSTCLFSLFTLLGTMGYGGKGNGGGILGVLRTIGKANPECVAWIGGFDKKSTSKDMNKKLKEHIESHGGAGCKYVEIGFKGTGGAIFMSEEECQAAIS